MYVHISLIFIIYEKLQHGLINSLLTQGIPCLCPSDELRLMMLLGGISDAALIIDGGIVQLYSKLGDFESFLGHQSLYILLLFIPFLSL